MTITSEQLQAIMPEADTQTIQTYLPYLNQEMPVYQINTPIRAGAFLAHLAHESGQFSVVTENLNYRAERLQVVFPKHFPSPAIAQLFAAKPEKIANKVYANRLGNGPEASGDGWRFKGRGLIQLTGRASYGDCSRALTGSKNTFQDAPELLATPQYAVASACWFWTVYKTLNEVADQPDTWVTMYKNKRYNKFQWLTIRINGGLNGYEDRLAFWERAKIVLK
jgi:putative chitinase